MRNNPELAYINSARQVGLALATGIDLSTKHEITHQFHSMDLNLAFRKTLEQLGYQVSERDDLPGFDARRLEFIRADQLKPVVEELCRTADKYSVEYDGWELTASINARLEEQ